MTVALKSSTAYAVTSPSRHDTNALTKRADALKVMSKIPAIVAIRVDNDHELKKHQHLLETLQICSVWEWRPLEINSDDTLSFSISRIFQVALSSSITQPIF